MIALLRRCVPLFALKYVLGGLDARKYAALLLFLGFRLQAQMIRFKERSQREERAVEIRIAGSRYTKQGADSSAVAAIAYLFWDSPVQVDTESSSQILFQKAGGYYMQRRRKDLLSAGEKNMGLNDCLNSRRSFYKVLASLMRAIIGPYMSVTGHAASHSVLKKGTEATISLMNQSA